MSKNKRQSPMLKIGKYFTLNEFVRSSTANKLFIDNIPDEASIVNLKRLCSEALDIIRFVFGSPVIVTSGYRSVELNAHVNGSPTSYHLSGRAADITSSDFNRLCSVVSSLVSSCVISPVEIIYHDSYIHIAL